MLSRVERLQPVLCGINYGPLAVAIAGAMWACDGIFRPYVSTRMNAEAVVAWEHIVSLVPLSPLIFHYLIKERKALGLRQWLWLFVIGVGGDALANTFITLGYSLGHLALVALLQQSQPVFGLLGACLVLREDFHAKVAIPLSLAAFVGLYLMMWPYAKEARHEHASEAWDGLKAGAYGLSAAIIWASETVIGRWLLQYSTPTLTTLELLVYRQFIGLLSLVTYVYVLSARPLCGLSGMECLHDTQPTPWQAAVIGLLAFIELSSHFIYYIGLSCTPAGVSVIMELTNPLLVLTVVPILTTLFDPQYERVPLEGEQIVGALILTASTALLGLHSAIVDGDEPHGLTVKAGQGWTPAPTTEDVEMVVCSAVCAEEETPAGQETEAHLETQTACDTPSPARQRLCSLAAQPSPSAHSKPGCLSGLPPRLSPAPSPPAMPAGPTGEGNGVVLRAHSSSRRHTIPPQAAVELEA
eukprot:GGOE01000389.1.p1 GENE.GGOE01000389.1~~GGOE01000389.1.p1  ORF type:complete len:470 (+),score=114.34 GGOE01000389.1:127-1536(+)